MPIDRKKIKRVCIPLELQSLEGATLRAIDGNERDTIYLLSNEVSKNKDASDAEKIANVGNYERQLIGMFLGTTDGSRMIGAEEDLAAEVNMLPICDRETILKKGREYNLGSVEETKKN